MRSMEVILTGYGALRSSGVKVPGKPTDVSEISLRIELPTLFQEILTTLGRLAADYVVKGGCGDPNMNYAKIPWVAIVDRSVSTAITQGYYVVLLFDEKMGGCYLSLNQGFTQYERRYASTKIAYQKIVRTAAIASELVAAPPGFVPGPIDLGATLQLGKGYELGSIFARRYEAAALPTRAEFYHDIEMLLATYDSLIAIAGREILKLAPPLATEEFQDEVEASARKPSEPDLPDGPLDPPQQLQGVQTGRYLRNPKIAAQALRHANFLCEIDPGHKSFVSKVTKQNFVEAHHLVPMSQQKNFNHSLDVPENVVSLCPTCHRLLHHGVPGGKAAILGSLWGPRLTQLQQRGVAVRLDQLIGFYGEQLGEDD